MCLGIRPGLALRNVFPLMMGRPFLIEYSGGPQAALLQPPEPPAGACRQTCPRPWPQEARQSSAKTCSNKFAGH